MGDGLKLSKDKRHRSSSSLAGSTLEGTRSERRLDKNASIQEVVNQFSIAEEKCDELQEKMDLMKSLKRKKKLKKKRSVTKVTEPPHTLEDIPFITVRTQPKKKVSQQATRLRRLDIPQNRTRGYLDPATVEQRRMIGQVRGFHHDFKNPAQECPGHLQSSSEKLPNLKLRRQRSHVDGDSMCSHRTHLSNEGQEVACGRDDITDELTNFDTFIQQADYSPVTNKSTGTRLAKSTNIRRRHVPKDVPRDVPMEGRASADHWHGGQRGEIPAPRRRQPVLRNIQQPASQVEERLMVELFNKSRKVSPSMRRQGTAPMIVAPMNPLPAKVLDEKLKKVHNTQNFEDEHEDNECLESMPISVETKQGTHHPRRIKFRSRRYEMPTVASQMKQAGIRSYYGHSNHTNIPFVVSKSTAPSHNIGVNIQQVLNGLKIQQPLSGIPLTIAHHMGLGHVPAYGAKSNNSNQHPSLDHHSEINAIRVGRRLLRLPSYKYISYSRMLNMYSEGDGMVPRFLRAIARPHYFYTSMYNLATNREDCDCATSKGRGRHEAKQSLAEYASLYREYEHVNNCINEGNSEPELERRKEELTNQLAAREEHIRRVVQDYRTVTEPEVPLRASVSTAEDAFRHSTFKVGECQS